MPTMKTKRKPATKKRAKKPRLCCVKACGRKFHRERLGLPFCRDHAEGLRSITITPRKKS